MNKDGRFNKVSYYRISFFSFISKLAVQNERGPRQPFPDRHIHITGSFGVKSEVKILMSILMYI